jgi:hypothetical protein
MVTAISKKQFLSAIVSTCEDFKLKIPADTIDVDKVNALFKHHTCNEHPSGNKDAFFGSYGVLYQHLSSLANNGAESQLPTADQFLKALNRKISKLQSTPSVSNHSPSVQTQRASVPYPTLNAAAQASVDRFAQIGGQPGRWRLLHNNTANGTTGIAISTDAINPGRLNGFGPYYLPDAEHTVIVAAGFSDIIEITGKHTLMEFNVTFEGQPGTVKVNGKALNLGESSIYLPENNPLVMQLMGKSSPPPTIVNDVQSSIPEKGHTK